jgi:cation diffusion facilitator CzcD-associated flavoprotein CzcO
MTIRTPSVAIIGAGISGLCMAIKLIQAGIGSVTIYEKAEAIGGTWRDNTYPGLACDVPSRFYQYSFAPNPNWSQCFSPGAEIRDYLETITDSFHLMKHGDFRDGYPSYARSPSTPDRPKVT